MNVKTQPMKQACIVFMDFAGSGVKILEVEGEKYERD